MIFYKIRTLLPGLPLLEERSPNVKFNFKKSIFLMIWKLCDLNKINIKKWNSEQGC